MKFEEIKELLQYNDYEGYESKVFMPNEIFNDLKENINNTPHIAFAYSYYYLISWLYRYAKYDKAKEQIGNSKIKEILGYKPETRSINNLIKKNGLLDKMGYTETVRDFPVIATFENGELEFTLVSEIDDKNDPIYDYAYSIEKIIRGNFPNNFTIKYPIKAFERELDEEGNIDWEGTFINVDNTHMIPFEVFMYCMSNDDIGCVGFYLYSYLKHKNDIHSEGYDVSLENLSRETGIKKSSLDKYLGMLKSYRLIDFIINQEFFAVGLKEEDRMANTYITNEFEMFRDKPESYQRINIMKKKDYIKMVREEEKAEFEKIYASEVDIPLEELPY